LNQNSKRENIYFIIKNILNILFEKIPTNSNGRRQTLLKLKGDRDQQLRLLKEKLLKPSILKQLVNINPQETAFLLWIEMNIELKEIIKAIKTIDGGNFEFSQSTKANNEDDFDNKSLSSASSFNLFTSDEFSSGTSSDLVLYEFIKVNRQFMFYLSHLSNEYIELYINLMCIFEPDKVAHYLRTKTSEFMYRFDECLKVCRDRKCWDAVAYLLEKSGQIDQAFNLYLEKLQTKIKLFLNEIASNCAVNQILDLKQSLNSNLNLIIELIQQNDYTLQDSVKEKIWFSLFDEIMLVISELSSIGKDVSPNPAQIDALQFFKNLGTHVINSMVGHINLNLIIEKLMSNKIYNIKYFADIKDLICKMIEIYKYERVLLQTTSKLVSKDVHKDLLMFKKAKTKAYTASGNFCQHCFKLFNDKSVLENLVNADNNLKVESINPTLTVFSCGHLYHTICFNQIKGEFTTCAQCNPSRYSINKNNESFKATDKYQSLNQNHSFNSSTSSPGSTSTNESTLYTNDKIEFSKEQIASLKLVRSRRIKPFIVNENSFESTNPNSSIINYGKQVIQPRLPGSQLNLAPANVSKFV
jgi:hypothetical protein